MKSKFTITRTMEVATQCDTCGWSGRAMPGFPEEKTHLLNNPDCRSIDIIRTSYLMRKEDFDRPAEERDHD